MVVRRKPADAGPHLGAAIALAHHRTEHLDGLLHPGGGHRRGGVGEVAQRAVVALAHARPRQQAVDGRRRQEQVGHAVAADGVHYGGGIEARQNDVGRPHHHHLQGGGAGGMGHGRGDQVHRPLGRRAQHRLGDTEGPGPVSGEHALGPAGGASGTGQGGDGVRRDEQLGPFVRRVPEPAAQPRRPVDADGLAYAGQSPAGLGRQLSEGLGVEQHRGVGVVEHIERLVQAVAGVDRNPGAAGAHHAQDAFERRDGVGAEHRHVGSDPEPVAQQGVGDTARGALDLRIAAPLIAEHQARPIGLDLDALVEELDEAEAHDRGSAATHIAPVMPPPCISAGSG